MNVRSPKYIFFACCVIFLSGCGRLIDWAKDSLYQGQDISSDLKAPQRFVRTVRIYDQLETAAIFDAIWLSDQVRTAYSDLTAMKYGKNEEASRAFLRRQLAENSHFITFYVLSGVNRPLGNPDSAWSVLLRMGDCLLTPIEIKTIDIEREYELFFGKRFNRFKVPYRVKFDNKDINGNPILTADVKRLVLEFRSFDKEAQLIWDII